MREGLKLMIKSALVRRNVALTSGHPMRALVKKAAQLDATTLIDVGANVGQYATLMRAAGFEGQIVSYEPLRDEVSTLKKRAMSDPKWSVVESALGATAGNAVIHVAGNSFSSSLLPMAKRHEQEAPKSAVSGSQDIVVRSFEDEVDRLGLNPRRILFKIDAQGFEMEVLKGAGRHLQDVQIVTLELSLVQLYEGAPLFREMWGWLEGRGFELWSLEPGFSAADGETLQCDGNVLEVCHR